jgi:hypothetical protein
MTDHKPLVDPELAELFADDPDALAIVRAISATQHAPRFRRRAKTALLAAVVVVVVAIVGGLTQQQSRASVVSRALAAFPTDRTFYVVLRASSPSGTTIDIATGLELHPRHVVHEWFNPRSGARRVVDQLGGVTIADVYVASASRAPAPSFSGEAAAGFASTYQRALETNPDADVRKGTLAGEPVYWIRFFHSRRISEVAVDHQTFVPVQAMFRDGSTREAFAIVSLETLTRGTPVPRSRSHLLPRKHSVNPATSIAVAILGRRVARLPLASVQPVRIDARRVGTEVLYGQATSGRLPSSFVRVDESSKRAPQLGWTSSIAALVRPGRIAIEQTGSFWNAYAQGHSRFFRLVTSEGRAVAIAAARHLASP